MLAQLVEGLLYETRLSQQLLPNVIYQIRSCELESVGEINIDSNAVFIDVLSLKKLIEGVCDIGYIRMHDIFIHVFTDPGFEVLEK